MKATRVYALRLLVSPQLWLRTEKNEQANVVHTHSTPTRKHTQQAKCEKKTQLRREFSTALHCTVLFGRCGWYQGTPDKLPYCFLSVH